MVWLFRQDDQLYERAAARPLGRFCLEAPDAKLQDVQTALPTLGALAMGFPRGLERLADLLPRLRRNSALVASS